MDCFDSLYYNRSNNRQQTINFVYELFNSVVAGYLNDSINIQVAGINVWTTPDPYRGDNRQNALDDLANYWKDFFWGNICVGLDFGNPGRFGLAGDIGRVKAVSSGACPAFNYDDGNKLSACCYNDMNYNVVVQNFPFGPNTTQQQVYLVMHEMGHLLGANHTKWCGWQLTPTSTGAIDSCGNTEGGCAKGQPPPPAGATIMSYCVTSNFNGNYVNYFNGFGRLPGNAIRNFLANNNCILNCIDCFGTLSKRKDNDFVFHPGTKNKNDNKDNGQMKSIAKEQVFIIPKF